MEVGQKVYLKPINNAARYGKEIIECVIDKVGRKYFYAHNIKFDLETMYNASNYAPDWQVYLYKQDILDERESEELTAIIRKCFDHYGKSNLSIQQLRQIKAIIEEPKKAKVTYPTDETISIDNCICPYCGHEFSGRRAINDDLDKRIIECPECKKEMEVYPSVEYMCSAMSEEEAT